LTWRVVAHQCTASQQREMLRRPSSKIDAEIAEAASITTPSTLKKQRASMKVEVGKVAAKVEEASPRKSRNKEVKTEMDVDEKSLDNEKESTLAIKINRVKAKAAPKEAQEPKERPRKRTATADDDLNPEENRANKTTKKRKTKEEKDREAMPLAARTAVTSLKHAMHIGAHVSAAGGEYHIRVKIILPDS
jgi:AP endonuclease-1